MTDVFVGIDTGNSGMKGMYGFAGTDEVHPFTKGFVHETTLSLLSADLERGSCIGVPSPEQTTILSRPKAARTHCSGR